MVAADQVKDDAEIVPPANVVSAEVADVASEAQLLSMPYNLSLSEDPAREEPLMVKSTCQLWRVDVTSKDLLIR